MHLREVAWPADLEVGPYAEALAWFQARVPMTDPAFRALDDEARKRAFWVAGLAQLDMVEDVQRSLAEALERGDDFRTWKDQIASQLLGAWGGSISDPGWRLETIFRTNVANAYGAGRWGQLNDDTVRDDRPFWQFDAVLDGRQTEVCDAADDTVLPGSDPWWRTHWPPLHFNCRSDVIALTPDEAAAHGVTRKPPQRGEPGQGFGTPPAPATDWAPDLSTYTPALAKVTEAKVEAAGAPLPTKAQVGVHVLGFKSLPKDDQDRILTFLGRDPRVLRALEHIPLDQVYGVNRPKAGWGGIWQAWVRRSDMLTHGPYRIGLNRATYLSPLALPGGFTTSLRHPVKNGERLLVTFAHELGHHLSQRSDLLSRYAAPEVLSFGRRVVELFKLYADKISGYAMTDPEEFLAECTACYFFQPERLNDDTRKLVNDLLDMRAKGIK